MRCPHCGGLNGPDAEWCGQCLASFEAEGSPGARRDGPPGGTASPIGNAPSPAAGTLARVVQVTGEGITWRCARCDSVNAFEVDVCSVCGSPFAATIRPRSEVPEKDPGRAALLSLLMPGAGHAYLGLWGQALARAITSLWVLFVMLAGAVQRGLFAPMPIVFAVASVALWGIAAHDAYREARGERAAILLTSRVFLYVVLGLVALSVVMVFTAVGA